ncbi:hypothetical protein [Nocardia sp. NPDC048505]|uniref:hypothetical protein n=1 Tax=unclassified Nocardia TaxID=2637762 RepID=UPI0033CECF8F
METLIILVAVALGGLSIWGTISFWTHGAYKRDRPDPTLSGFRPGDDTESDR